MARKPGMCSDKGGGDNATCHFDKPAKVHSETKILLSRAMLQVIMLDICRSRKVGVTCRKERWEGDLSLRLRSALSRHCLFLNE